MKLITYLNFDGNARDAMTFYSQCLEAELQVMPFSEAPQQMPQEAGDRVMHARLTKGDVLLMASDCMPGMHYQQGNNFSVSIDCESRAETEKIFTTLSEGGKITMPLQDMFWGAYFGMCTDQFGVNWMLNFQQTPLQ